MKQKKLKYSRKQYHVEPDFLENGGITKLLLYYLNHPEGVMRVDYRTKVRLSTRAAARDHDVLYDLGLITPVPNKNKLMFCLTKKGIVVAQKVEEISKV